jgi:hypothetical protein
MDPTSSFMRAVREGREDYVLRLMQRFPRLVHAKDRLGE